MPTINVLKFFFFFFSMTFSVFTAERKSLYIVWATFCSQFETLSTGDRTTLVRNDLGFFKALFPSMT